MKGTIRTPKDWCSSQAACSLLLVVLLSGLLPALPASAANGSSSPGEDTPPAEALGPASDAVIAIPLEDLLAADGTLHVLPGQHGSIDARGWRMVSEDGDAPRFAPQAPGDENWWDGFYLNGLNNAVYALAFDSSGNLYAGGAFTYAGTVSINHVARWDPLTATWNALGSGTNDRVEALAVDGSGMLYAGGWFTDAGGVSANRIARWDPLTQTWSALDSGVDGDVYTLAVDDNGNLYAGGGFTYAGGVIASGIARWDSFTQTWNALSSGMDDYVRALAFDSSGNLYAGGWFTTAGGVSANYIARWDPLTQTWSALGSGMDDRVETLAVDGSDTLYAGGWFTDAGGVSANQVARWDPLTQTWSALGSGASSTVNALAVDGNGNLYAGGSFTTAGGGSANRVARWDPPTQTWSALGSGADNTVYGLAFDNSENLYAGGSFTTAGGGPSEFISHWDGAVWGALFGDTRGRGVAGSILALAFDSSGNLYAGGAFTTAGVVSAKNIARWDQLTSTWSALGSGMNDVVRALVFDSNGNLYAGGSFTTAGGVSANRVARWDPLTQTWNALGSGMGSTVYALSVDGNGNLYAGGAFAGSGHVVRWDPLTSSWNPLGSGTNSWVYALAIDSSGNLYVGGAFTTAGGVSAKNIARWDPLTSSWSALGSGTNINVFALAFDGSGNLYAGGWFTTAGGVSANRVARWDPLTATWSALGSGTNNYVRALAFDSSGNLYVGGEFTIAGGASANRVARWDPLTQTWSALGSGVNNFVRALACNGSRDLYTGGIFTAAGGKPSWRIARWVSSNMAPVAVDDNYTTAEDTPLTVAAPGVLSNDSDTDGDPLAAALTTAPAVGDLAFELDGSFTYTPALNYNGTVTFTYAAKDGLAWSNTALVTITITPVNDPPVLAPIGDQIVDELTSLSFTTSASDVELDDFTFSLDPGAPAGAAITPSGDFTWTPSEAQGPGMYTVTVRVTDDGAPAASASETIQITVNEVNLAPVLASISDQIVAEGNLLTFTAAATDPDLPANTLAFSLDPGAPTGAAIDPITGLFTWTPSEAQGPGVYNITVRVTDNGAPALDDFETIQITVGEINLPPGAADDLYGTPEDTPLVVAAPGLLVNDTDPDLPPNALSAAIGTPPALGELALAVDGSFVYMPTLNFNGAITFVYILSDGVLTDTATATITIAAVNDPPVLASIGDQIVDELTLLSFTANASDVELDNFTFSLDPGAPAGAAITSGGDFTWTPTEAQGPGVYTVTVRVTDDGSPAASSSETIQITVSEVNLAPVLNPIGDRSGDELTLISFTASADDADDPANTLTFSLDPGAPAGASITADGAFTWTPTEAQGPGVYPVTVRVADDGAPALEDFETLDITVGEVNQAPTAVNDTYATDEDTPLVVSAPGLLLNDSDPDLPPNAISAMLDTPPALGELALAADGSFVYTPTLDFNGLVTFTYHANDGLVSSNVALVGIDVTSVNDAPMAEDQAFTTAEDTAYAGVLAGSDVDGDPLTFSLDTAPAHGSVTIAANGAYTYTPDLNYNGPDGFTFVASDGSLLDVGQVSITVDPVNDAPIPDAGADVDATEGELVQFSGSYADPGKQLSVASDQSPVAPMVVTALAVEWDFGDGATASATLTPTHTYADDGVYTVTLVVTDDLGGVGTDTLLVTVDNVAPNLAPIADQSVIAGLILTVTATYADPGQLDTQTAMITWGDGLTETLYLDSGLISFDFAHTFDTAGVYTVIVTLTDDDGGQDMQIFIIEVEPASFNTWLPVVLKR